jgi:integrase
VARCEGHSRAQRADAAGEQIKAVRTAWRATCARAGIQGLHFHDLRREFGSRVLESGSSLVEARDLLGHANISQTSTYLQSTAKSLGLAIERKEAHERERQQARARAREQQQAQQAAEKDCHTMAECDNEQAPVTLASEPVQVTKH